MSSPYLVRQDFTFDQGGSTPGRKHKFKPGDGVAWEHYDVDGRPYWQHGYVVDWAVKSGRGHYQVVRMTGRHFGATPWGRPKWIVSYSLKPTGKWWKGLLRQYRANQKLEERGCVCNCCVHEVIPRSTLKMDGTFREGYDE